MYVVLDTAVIVSDPSCSGNVWKILAHVSDSWGLKLVVPEVVIIEAVACYDREISDIRERLEGTAKSKRFHALGIDAVSTVALNELEERSQDYRDRLTQMLTSLGVTFLAPPDVSHEQIVARATKRRKPCDSKGDGYRDTLNWLSILELLERHDEDVAWVSSNTKDFGADNAESNDDAAIDLHPQLIEELAAAGHGGRVRYARDLGKLVMSIASDLAPDLPQDMHDLTERVRQDTLIEFVGTFLDDQLPRPVDPESTALPLNASFGTVVFLANIKDLTFEIVGSAGDGSAIATFTGICGSAIEIGTSDEDASEFESGEQPLALVKKDLKYTGFVILDSLGKPQSGELTTVTALDNDPGKVDWASLRVRSALLRRLQKQLKEGKGRSDIVTRVRGEKFVRQVLENEIVHGRPLHKIDEKWLTEFIHVLSESAGPDWRSRPAGDSYGHGFSTGDIDTTTETPGEDGP